MHGHRPATGVGVSGGCRLARYGLIAWILPALCPFAAADIVHLSSGGTIEGDVLERTAEILRIRTTLGTVAVPLASVERIEESRTPFAEYDRRLAELADSQQADDWATLAAWCHEHDLAAQGDRHYARALELDPDQAAARAALDYVRVGDDWVKAARVTTSAPAQPASQPAAEEPPSDEDLAAEVERLRARWRMRVRAIRDQLLESSLERSRQHGLEQISEIQDPLAIEALTRTLSEGGELSRAALVDALARFPQDEATLDLLAIALLEPLGRLRFKAAVELRRRDDPRIIPQLREALHVPNSNVVRSAADLLGMLDATAAVPDLIDALFATERKAVEIPTRSYFGRLERDFTGQSEVRLGGASYKWSPELRIPKQAGIATLVDSRFEVRDVRVYRTEVLEALKKLTGRNFGFDARAWSNWYEKEQAK